MRRRQVAPLAARLLAGVVRTCFFAVGSDMMLVPLPRGPRPKWRPLRREAERLRLCHLGRRKCIGKLCACGESFAFFSLW